MARSKGNRNKKGDAAECISPTLSALTFGNGGPDEGTPISGTPTSPPLPGRSFEVAVVGSGSAPGGSANGPACIFLSPPLMMAEAIGTGDLLAVALLGLDGEPTNLTPQNEQSRSNTLASGTAGEVGCFFTLAEAWPSPKLARDAARLPPPLADSLAHPPGGSLLRIYPVEKSNSPRTSSSPQMSPGPKTASLQASLSAQKSPVKVTGSAESAPHVRAQVRPCSHLQLRWRPPPEVIHTKPLPLPLSPLPAQGGISTLGPGTPPRTSKPSLAQPPLSPSTPKPQTPSNFRSSGSRTPVSRTPDSETPNPHTPNPQTPKTQTPRGRAATPRGRKTPGGSDSPSASPSKRNDERKADPGMTDGQRAAVTALLEDGTGKGVVETFAARWLAGRHLLEGNHVIVPLCGFNCTFQVVHATHSETATCTPPTDSSFSFRPAIPAAAAPALPLVAFSVVGATRVSLLEPGGLEVGKGMNEEKRNGGVDLPGSASGGLGGEEERVGYAELGGVGAQIKALKELVELPLKKPEMFRRYGIRPPRGVLLYGPPGTGKTLLARAAASESGASMFVINGPEIVSAHYGESEEALRDVFAAAEKAAPSVVFIDELDAIAPARDTGTEDMAQRMVAALLTLLDGGTGDFNRVIVIAATNRPDSIDPALRRPGRFDRELEIGVPTPKGRLEILHTLLRSKRHDLRPADVNALAAATHGFVGADLAALCNEAALNALRRIVLARSSAHVGTFEPLVVPAGDWKSTDQHVGIPEPLEVQYGDRNTADTTEAFERDTHGGGELGVASKSESDGIGNSDSDGLNTGRQTRQDSPATTSDNGEGDARPGLRTGHNGTNRELDVRIDTDVTQRLASLHLAKGDESAGPTAGASPDIARLNPPNPSGSASLLDSTSQPGAGQPKQSRVESAPTSRFQTPFELLQDPNSYQNPRTTQNPQAVPNPQTPTFACVTKADFAAAQTKVRPSAMREVMIEVPRVRWADIGGQEATKQKLQETVEWPQKHPEAFTRVGAQPPRGVLLYGPPGCSKTLMARAVATEAGLNFIAVKGPEIFSKWVGESEKAVRALFARARASAPSVIFFDEIDGLAATRDDGSTDGGNGVSERVMSQLLIEMDGLSARAGVAVIGATNRPDIIDPALLRPGRFDRLLFVEPPDRAARGQIFDIRLRNTPCDSDVRIQELAACTDKYTGADIAAVCREAALAALEEDLSATGVAQRHFAAALKAVGPSISPHDEAFYASFRRG